MAGSQGDKIDHVLCVDMMDVNDMTSFSKHIIMTDVKAIGWQLFKMTASTLNETQQYPQHSQPIISPITTTAQ